MEELEAAEKEFTDKQDALEQEEGYVDVSDDDVDSLDADELFD
jgi:hypothetical protein